MSEVESRARSYVREKEAKAARQPKAGTTTGRGNSGAVGGATAAARSPGTRKNGAPETGRAQEGGSAAAAADAADAAAAGAAAGGGGAAAGAVAGSEDGGNPFVAGPGSRCG